MRSCPIESSASALLQPPSCKYKPGDRSNQASGFLGWPPELQVQTIGKGPVVAPPNLASDFHKDRYSQATGNLGWLMPEVSEPREVHARSDVNV
eukprot:1436403-Amphidinium_carterae.1